MPMSRDSDVGAVHWAVADHPNWASSSYAAGVARQMMDLPSIQ